MTADPAALGLPAEVGESGLDEPDRRRWRPTRLQISMGIWVVFVGLLLAKWRVTTNQNQLFVIIGTGLIAAGAGRLHHIGQVVKDWFPLFVILAVYGELRNLAANWFTVHVTPQIDIDKALFGVVPTVWLQHELFTPGRLHWYDVVAFTVYLSHFFVSLVVAAILWKFAYPRFRRFVVLFVSLTFAAFITYALFPAAPPWLASQSNQLAPTARIIDEVWTHIGLHSGVSLFSAKSSLANPVAAVPSLHAAYPLLLMLFFWDSAKKWRWLLPLYPLAMAFSLVYTGEHYVFDILLGWVYAATIYFVGTWAMNAWSRRRAVRRAAPEPGAEPEVLVGAALSSPG
jgi:membrane-associated phospholipid phosphatase